MGKWTATPELLPYVYKCICRRTCSAATHPRIRTPVTSRTLAMVPFLTPSPAMDGTLLDKGLTFLEADWGLYEPLRAAALFSACGLAPHLVSGLGAI